MAQSRFMWTFGNAVQDITVEVDLDRLSREPDNVGQPVRLEQVPLIQRGLWLKTRMGLQDFAVQMNLDPADKNTDLEDSYYRLKPGDKHTLLGDIERSHVKVTEPSLFLPCENVSWGGGGVNAVTFMRALAPDKNNLPIKYTDIAMRGSLELVVREFAALQNELDQNELTPEASQAKVATQLRELHEKDPARFEQVTARIAEIAAQYTPERSLEVYLKSLPVDFALYRPRDARPRRNWVFSRFRGANKAIENKIISRGTYTPLADAEELAIATLLAAHTDGVGAILLNSLKDGPLFRAAYSAYKNAYRADNRVVGILAMTEAMQQFTPWLREDKFRDKGFPPFILILNEKEAFKLASQFATDLKPFMDAADDLPNIRRFARIAVTLLREFSYGRTPRIYVTLGPRGSLGVDGFGNVVYVSTYTKPGGLIYDTNACGDAYCAVISMLEWAKRNGYPDIADVHADDGPETSAREMIYFMAVAAAAAYGKATNRRGRVDATEVKDLLEHIHLASAILPPSLNLADKSAHPACVDGNDRLRTPSGATFMRVTKGLRSLMS